MSHVAFELTLLLLLILANGAFSLAEIALVSARRARLISAADRGSAGAAAALELKDQPDQFLATVQVGITLIGIFTGAFGGATLTGALSAWLAGFPVIARHAGTISLTLVVLGITFLSLVLGELAPKRLALNNPERIAVIAAGPMRVLSRVSAPLVHLLSFSAALVTRLLGMRPSPEPAVTEEEVRALLHEGAQAGVFEPQEREMVEAVFRLGDRRVGALATPRQQVTWLAADSTPEEVRETLEAHPFSRYPVYEGTPDHVVGVVEARALLLDLLRGGTFDLRRAMRKPLFLSEATRAFRALEVLKEHGEHLAVIVDEHGGTFGVLTPTDVAESIIGDLPQAPASRPEAQIIEREDGSLLIDGMTPIDELQGLLGGQTGQGGYSTLAGFLLERLGRIPEVGAKIEVDGLRFEVVDMDGLRVDRVLVSKVP